jgi:hypothetical protein
MKKFLLFIPLLFCVTIKAQPAIRTVDSSSAAIMTFENDTANFGTVKAGTQVEFDFKFKNTGKVPLTISDCNTSCGCDVASYPKEPIPPGKSGIIHYKLDTTSKQGLQVKQVSIYYNYNTTHVVLYVKGNVTQSPSR